MLEIKSLNHDFNGIGKLNEKVIFVKDALPGEVVDIKIIKEKKSYSEAIVTKYIKTSKNRVKPKCKYFGFCGGCNIMNINYLNQLKCKEEKINNIIKKYIKKDVKINPIIYDNDIGYRNKIKFQIGNKVGFFKNNSYEVINIDNCKIANKKKLKQSKEMKLYKNKVNPIIIKDINLNKKKKFKNKNKDKNRFCYQILWALKSIFCNNFFFFYKNNTNLKNRKYMLIKCGHAFHTECLEKWFEMKKECPSCRASMENYI